MIPILPPFPTVVLAALIVWSSGAPLERGRDHHVVIELAGDAGTPAGGLSALLVVGGTDYREMFADAAVATIEADGGIREWRAAPSLPEPRAGAVGAGVGQWVVVAGGQRPDLTRVADVWVARVEVGRVGVGGAAGVADAADAAGPGPGARPVIGPWSAGPPLPGPSFHGAASVAGGRIYVTGGQGAEQAVGSVYVMEVTPTGPGEWRELAPLPAPRSHHASAVHGGALWLIGGLQGHPARGPTPLFDVLRAEILEDGALGPWRSVSLMPHSYATHSAFFHDDALWVLGGVEDNRRFVDAVWRASVDGEGRLGEWERVEPGLPSPRAHVHVTPVVGGRVYSVGGSASRQVRAAVDIGALRP